MNGDYNPSANLIRDINKTYRYGDATGIDVCPLFKYITNYCCYYCG